MRITDIFKTVVTFFESTALVEPQTYTIVRAKAYNKNKIKYSNKKSNIQLLDTLVARLHTDGSIETNNAHRIKQPLYSEHIKGNIDGWVSVWISSSDDLRLVYKRFKDGTIEVKFGKAKDIGYTH